MPARGEAWWCELPDLGRRPPVVLAAAHASFTAGLGFAETGYGSARTRSAHFIAAATSGPVVLRWPPSPTTASTTLGRRRDGKLVR